MLETVVTIIACVAVLAAAAKLAGSRRGRGLRIYPPALVVALVAGFAGLFIAARAAGLGSASWGSGFLAVWFLAEGLFDMWKNSEPTDRVFAEQHAGESDEPDPTPSREPTIVKVKRPQDHRAAKIATGMTERR